jgi:hypothetical protein
MSSCLAECLPLDGLVDLVTDSLFEPSAGGLNSAKASQMCACLDLHLKHHMDVLDAADLNIYNLIGNYNQLERQRQQFADAGVELPQPVLRADEASPEQVAQQLQLTARHIHTAADTAAELRASVLEPQFEHELSEVGSAEYEHAAKELQAVAAAAERVYQAGLRAAAC